MGNTNSDQRRDWYTDFGQRVLRGMRKERGLTQEAFGASVGIAQWTVSRIESGTAKPKDLDELHQLANAYELSREDRDEWEEHVFGGPEQETSGRWDDLVVSFGDHARTFHAAKTDGSPDTVILRAPEVSKHILEVLQDAPRAYRRNFTEILKQIQYILGCVYSEVSRPRENWARTRSRYIRDLRGLASVGGFVDPEFYGIADQFVGDGLYISRAHHDSIRSLASALETIKDPVDILHTWRTIALNWAYLGEKKDSLMALSNARAFLDEVKEKDLPLVLGVYEGLARSQAYLGLEDSAFSTLDELKAAYAKNTVRAPLREIQLVRTQVELIARFQPKNKRMLEALGKEGIALATDRCPRLAWYIQQILNQAL